MGESLFDGVSIAVVCSGAVAIVLLQTSFAETANPGRSRWLNVVGHLCLGLSVSLLLYRWIDGVMSLSIESRPDVWRSGALVAACGIGLVAAVKSVVGPTASSRILNLLAAVALCEGALLLAGAWFWALLLQLLLLGGIAIVKWVPLRTEAALQDDERDTVGEPALVILASAVWLMLLLGTWQHVQKYESQRTTRSPRHSAWPRASALKDAWERTGWTARSSRTDSSHQTSSPAAREQQVALGLGALWLVVVAVAWCQPKLTPADLETDHAN